MTNIRPLNPLLALRARNELGEVPERIDDDIETLREWINKQSHLNARTDDQLLVGFLRGCKYSIEKAKQKVDCFYAMRTPLSEIYKNRSVDDPKVIELIRQGNILRLLKPLKEDGPRIHISRFGYDASKYNLADIMRVNAMIMEIQIMEDDNAMIEGFVEIEDLKGISTAHIFQFDPVFVKKLATWSDKGWPCRPKGIHIINAPTGTETIMSLVRSFLPEKIKKRFHVHSNLESLHQYIPKEYLPVEYGGDNGTIQNTCETWEKTLLSYRDYFKEDSKYGTNEKLRPGKHVNNPAGTQAGMDGSFRKLDID